MALFTTQNPWVFAFGILGNIISFMVYLAPIPTFRRVIKKKSTEGFQSIPYLVALFSAMLWIYYAGMKSNSTLLITINSFGCVIETIYIAIYIAYAPKKTRIMTLKMLLLLNFGGFCLIVLFSHFLAVGPKRVQVLGWVNLVFSVCVFAAPLSIMTQVIRTKSVEFMPFGLSLFLALSAVMWFFYGLLQGDMFITLPNILGFIFAVLQMVLYVIYKNNKKVPEEHTLPTALKPNTNVKNSEVHPVCSLPNFDENKEIKDQNVQEHNDDRIELSTDGPNQV